ncbi:vesicle transport through interaction with t-SNAREs homolog 1A isoform X1 [Cinclus cinclus]
MLHNKAEDFKDSPVFFFFFFLLMCGSPCVRMSHRINLESVLADTYNLLKWYVFSFMVRAQLYWYFHNFVSDEKKQMVANVEKQLEEARELLEQMELEVREIPPQSRGMYSSRMRSYKQEMGKLEADFKRSRIAYSDEVRNELLGDDGNSSENQRAHLLDNTERLERSSRRLEAGYQIAVETEQIGQEMLENLSHDREKIQRARERLRETDANLGKSSRILTGMLRRIIQNRILIVVLAVIIIFTTMMAIYFSVRGR